MCSSVRGVLSTHRGTRFDSALNLVITLEQQHCSDLQRIQIDTRHVDASRLCHASLACFEHARLSGTHAQTTLAALVTIALELSLAPSFVLDHPRTLQLSHVVVLLFGPSLLLVPTHDL